MLYTWAFFLCPKTWQMAVYCVTCIIIDVHFIYHISHLFVQSSDDLITDKMNNDVGLYISATLYSTSRPMLKVVFAETVVTWPVVEFTKPHIHLIKKDDGLTFGFHAFCSTEAFRQAVQKEKQVIICVHY